VCMCVCLHACVIRCMIEVGGHADCIGVKSAGRVGMGRLS